jgi:hypothetical protein
MLNRRVACLLVACCIVAGVWVSIAQGDDNRPSPQLGLSAWVFATDAAGPVNNVALMWATAEPSDQFEVQRATKESGPFEKIYTGTGRSFRDYGLADGAYFYRLIAHQKQTQLTSNIATVTTMAMPSGLEAFSNQKTNETGLPEKPIEVGDTFYKFPAVREGKGLRAVLRTSTDGKNWTDGPVVLDQSSNPDLADAKFEASTQFYDPIHNQIVWWCHWERSQGYANGRAFVATAKPGEWFTVHHIYNPLGIQVRDMSVFVDDDHHGYLVAATNKPGQGANATLRIFKLNDTYDDAVEVVATLLENGYREAPHIVKDHGFYYLFFSQAAGWYPSQGGYVSAQSINGPWSPARAIGNPSTFSSQSGDVIPYGDAEPHVPVMMGNRWMRGQGTSSQVAMPVHFADGFAFYDYAPTLLYDPARSLIIPLDMGRLLSQDRPAESSIAGKAGQEAAKAFDGDYTSSFQSDDKHWPFELTTDLGGPCTIRNVQISWFIHKGSEAFYTYTIEGSADGQKWSTLLDRSNASDAVLSKTYGFTSDVLPANSSARYVKIKVTQAHLHNNPNNWYSPTVYEIKVFGDPRT